MAPVTLATPSMRPAAGGGRVPALPSRQRLARGKSGFLGDCQARHRLENRKILVTGGASGIGRATCELFAREGAAVAVIDRDTARIGTARAIAADVSDPASVARAIQQAAQVLGGLDGLVNAAGVFINRGLMETTTDDGTPRSR